MGSSGARKEHFRSWPTRHEDNPTDDDGNPHHVCMNPAVKEESRREQARKGNSTLKVT